MEDLYFMGKFFFFYLFSRKFSFRSTFSLYNNDRMRLPSLLFNFGSSDGLTGTG